MPNYQYPHENPPPPRPPDYDNHNDCANCANFYDGKCLSVFCHYEEERI